MVCRNVGEGVGGHGANRNAVDLNLFHDIALVRRDRECLTVAVIHHHNARGRNCPVRAGTCINAVLDAAERRMDGIIPGHIVKRVGAYRTGRDTVHQHSFDQIPGIRGDGELLVGAVLNNYVA